MIESPPSPVYPLRPDIEDYFALANSNKLREPNRLGGRGGRSGGITMLYYQLVRGTNPGHRGRRICLGRTFLRWVQCVRWEQIPVVVGGGSACRSPSDAAGGQSRQRDEAPAMAAPSEGGERAANGSPMTNEIHNTRFQPCLA
jgi:hypothetical protein